MINNTIKNSLFTTLFEEPSVLRELYCALEDISLPPDTPVSINTLKNVFFMGIYNDISFEIDGKLVVLIEHQSTLNPNMALRLLMYIADVYEKMVEGRKTYSEKLLKIPRPEFFVLYNGTKPFPDEEIIRLSDAFENPQELGLSGKPFPALELMVRVININEGRNEAILKRCKKLAEYSAFVAKARSLEQELGNREEAVISAIKYCHKHGIIKDILETHAKEVLSMLYTEWNMDDALAVRYEEGMEEGKLQIAKNLLAAGSSPEFVQQITGLDIKIIQKLQPNK